MTYKTTFVIILLALTAGTALADDGRFSFELVGADLDFDLSDRALVNRIDPVVSGTVPMANPGTGVARATFAMKLNEIELFATWQPELEVEGSTGFGVSGPGGELLVTSRRWAHVEAWDLGVRRELKLTRVVSLTPRLGVTRLEHGHHSVTDQSTPPPTLHGRSQSYRTDASQWGLMLGLGAEFQVHDRVSVVLDGATRWATGTQTTHFEETHMIYDDSGTLIGVQVDSIGHGTSDESTLMAEGSVGVQVRLAAGLRAEAGWTYRDWTRDGGPGSFSGFTLGAGVSW